MSAGQFFAIDGLAWPRVCDLGLSAAVCYVVLARGTSRDNVTTAWSIEAVATYTGIGRIRARRALARLIDAGLVTVLRSGTKPRYRLTQTSPATTTSNMTTKTKWAGTSTPTTPTRIWLPNQLVTGAKGEVPPLELVRQMQDVQTLRLLIDLYGAHRLRDDRGIDVRILREEWTRVRVGAFAEYVVWGFYRKHCVVCFSDPWVRVHERRNLTAAERRAGSNGAIDFFPRLDALLDVQLVRWTRYLMDSDGPDAEPIHVVGIGGETEERAVASAAHRAGLAMITEGQRAWCLDHDTPLSLVPVRRHLARVQLVGVARLTYRPHTSATSLWWGAHLAEIRSQITRFVELEARAAGRRDQEATG